MYRASTSRSYVILMAILQSRRLVCWDRNDAFARRFRPVRNGRQDILVREVRVRREEILLALTIRQDVENQRDPDPRALDAGLAEADAGIDADALKQGVHCRHLDGFL